MAKITITTDLSPLPNLEGAGSPQPEPIAHEVGNDCIGPQVPSIAVESSNIAIPPATIRPVAVGEMPPSLQGDVTPGPKSQPAPSTLHNREPSIPPQVIEELNKGRYDGDKLDDSGPLESNKSGTWETIPFESALELIYYFDNSLNTGIRNLHGWQIETLEELCFVGRPKEEHPTQYKPHRFALCAANGSGKDAYVVAPFVVWFALTKIRSLCVITSSSGVQLTAQTENYIASLCRAVNTHFGEPIFKVTRRFIKCLKSGSEIRLFATDEAGKAEGYHPFPDFAGSEMAIIVNEAKSVLPEIFGALSRCTGYNYMVYVSTPNEPVGDFYEAFVNRTGNWKHNRRVTAFDCPHISHEHIEEVRKSKGEHSSIYRSQVLALFTSIGGSVVIDQDHLNRCIEQSKKGIVKPKKFGKVKVGIDTALGRDENALVAIHGNVIISKYFFVEKDTTVTEDKIDAWLNKLYQDNGGRDNVEVYGDDSGGGGGHGIFDHLVKRGHIVNRVLNQQRAFESKQFANRGTEMWYNMRRIIEECLLFLPIESNEVANKDDAKLYHQLAYRHFKRNETTGRIALMSKSDERAEGHESPDRADALALSLSSVHHEEIEKAIRNSDVKEAGYTFDQLRQLKYENYRAAMLGKGQKGTPIRGNSIEELFAQKGIK